MDRWVRHVGAILLTAAIGFALCGCNQQRGPMTAERMKEVVRSHLRAEYLFAGERFEEVEWSGLYRSKPRHVMTWVKETPVGKRRGEIPAGQAYAMKLWFRPERDHRGGGDPMSPLFPSGAAGLSAEVREELPGILVICSADGSYVDSGPASRRELDEVFDMVAAPPPTAPVAGGPLPPPPPPAAVSPGGASPPPPPPGG